MKCKHIPIRSHRCDVECIEHKSLWKLKRFKHLNINLNNMKKLRKGSFNVQYNVWISLQMLYVNCMMVKEIWRFISPKSHICRGICPREEWLFGVKIFIFPEHSCNKSFIIPNNKWWNTIRWLLISFWLVAIITSWFCFFFLIVYLCFHN